MDELKRSISEELEHHMLPFWNNMIDEKYGGFYGELTYDLCLNKEADKGGIASARLLWTYSNLYRYIRDESLLLYVEHLYEFLIEHIIDKVHGGIVWMVDYKGDTVDDRKHVYAQAFCIYALSEYYLATQKEQSLVLCMDLFELIETVGFDSYQKGYLEEFSNDWLLKDNEMLSENGVMAYFTMNTHLHILEAYTNLYKAGGDYRVGNALLNLVNTFKNQFFDKEKGSLIVFFDKNWKSIIDMNSYGHDIEALWLLDEAMEVLKLEDLELKNILITIGENIYKRAIQPDGSILNEIENSLVDDTRVWWGQSEAMVGFITLFNITKDEKYLKTVTNLWNYIDKNIIDKRPGSEWFWSVDHEGKPTTRPIVEPWKTPYHNVRSCIQVLTRL